MSKSLYKGVTIGLAVALVLALPALSHADHCPDSVPDGESLDGDFQFKGADVYYESRNIPQSNGFATYYYCIDNNENPRDIYIEWGDNKDDLLFDKFVPRQMKLRSYRTDEGDADNSHQVLRYGSDSDSLDDQVDRLTYHPPNYAGLDSRKLLQLTQAPNYFLTPKEFGARIGTFPNEKLPEVFSQEMLAQPGKLRELLNKALVNGDGYGLVSGGDFMIPATTASLDRILSGGDAGLEGDRGPYVHIEMWVWSGIVKFEDEVRFVSQFFARVRDPDLEAFQRFETGDKVLLLSPRNNIEKLDMPLDSLFDAQDPRARIVLSIHSFNGDRPVRRELSLLRLVGPNGFKFGSIAFPVFQ